MDPAVAQQLAQLDARIADLGLKTQPQAIRDSLEYTWDPRGKGTPYSYTPPAVEGWREIGAAGQPAFQNGWVNLGAPWATAAFYKDPDGRVWLRGLVKNGLSGLPIFTVPAGYPPPINEVFGADTGSGAASGLHGRVDVYPNGAVSHQVGGATYFSLSGVSWRAA